MYNQLHGYCMGTVIIPQNCLINNQLMGCKFLVGTFQWVKLQQFNLLSIVECNAHLVNLQNIGNPEYVIR
jgi:hypothetical protein